MTTSNIIELQTLADYTNAVANNAMVVLNFYASWCSACAETDTYWPQLAASYPTVAFCSANVQNTAFTPLLAQYNVTNFPTFVYYHDKTEVNIQVGANSYMSGINTKNLTKMT
jgi:thioredoxin 1